MARLVLKVGGHELDDPQFVAGLVKAIGQLPERPVLVHGGGKEISQLQQGLGLTGSFVGGMRVTDDATLRIAVMVMAGLANKRLVAQFNAAGVPALGVSGVDLGALQVEKWPHPGGDLGWVGRVEKVNREALEALLGLDATLIMAPISADAQGQLYNVNADHAAQAVARGLGSEALVFVTNVPGVMRGGDVIAKLRQDEALEMIRDGVIVGGMEAKVRAALDAVASGVRTARIVNLASLAAGGTAITA